MNAKDQKKEERINLCQKVIEYFNDQAGRGFDSKTRGTLKLFTAEWSHTYNYPQYKGVIDYLVLKWKNDEYMQQYLRPATLFGPEKFPEYLAQARDLIKVEIQTKRRRPFSTYIPVERAPSNKLIPFTKYDPT